MANKGLSWSNWSKEEIASWGDGNKCCRSCLAIKPLSQFDKSITTLFGVSNKCKDCRSVESKESWKGCSFEQSMYNSAKGRARRKGLPFTIKVEDIIIPERCPILGVEIALERNHRYGPSIDQIVPGAGYTPENILVMSKRANTLKNDMTKEEAVAILNWFESN